MGLKAFTIIELARVAYKMILRDLLKAAIDDPEREWDDIVLSICDRIFSYVEIDAAL